MSDETIRKLWKGLIAQSGKEAQAFLLLCEVSAPGVQVALTIFEMIEAKVDLKKLLTRDEYQCFENTKGVYVLMAESSKKTKKLTDSMPSSSPDPVKTMDKIFKEIEKL